MTTYPWELASQQHMIYRMTDAELTSAMVEACQAPRSIAYLSVMRLATHTRRDRLGILDNMLILSALAAAAEACTARDGRGV
jgi:hypothetical protein